MQNKLLRRILIAFSVSVACVILFLVVTVSHVAYQNAIERYGNETRASVNVFSQNMDSYITNCVSAMRSIYSDSSLLSLLTKPHETLPDQADRASILQYLKTVHYACSPAIQIFLSCPNLHQSYLYDPSVMMMTYSGLNMDNGNEPSFSSYLDVYIEPTHPIVNYGHKTTYFNQRQEKQVLTLWFPIYDLPKNSARIAALAIDLPVDFILSDSKLVVNPQEQVFVSTQEGRIIAATNEQWIENNTAQLLSEAAINHLRENNFTISGKTLIISYDIALQYCNWKIYKLVPLSLVFDKTWNMISMCMILFIVLLVLLFLINAQNIRRQLSPLQRITHYMQQTANQQSGKTLGSLTDYMNYKGHDEIQKLISTFDWMMQTMENYRVKQYEMEIAYDRSIYKMLQAQINPHFIYNIMQCFATNALRHQDLEQYRMLSSFGQMMHYAMVLNPYMVALRQELEYVERYVNLQRMRFSSEDQMIWHAEPEALRLSVPKMCLQPLVENSIVHGKLFQKSGSRLEISASCHEDWLSICVRDNGEPVSEETRRQLRDKLEQLRNHAANRDLYSEKDYFRNASTGLEENGRSGSIGIENVYNRLLLLFSDVKMDIYGNEWGGTTVELQLCMSAMKGDDRI